MRFTLGCYIVSLIVHCVLYVMFDDEFSLYMLCAIAGILLVLVFSSLVEEPA